eukprot:CAMPEP_0168314600 /NCGR_PEP_ID=MMETSP0210-20121227/9164_1 /TAXON_ID=40633 /ORGANISM="Condylostoma magnum, Strain COL2" /LENGTH=90 /DNA_ID=CAMNT_0008284441 /DNA_START=1706 /DNA_END=1978 /DNA_ORIENTATION=-
MSGPIEFNGKQWYIQAKSSDPDPANDYVTEIKESFEIVKQPYQKLMKPFSEAQLENFNTLKSNLRKSAWKLFKLLLLGTAGSPEVSNEAK